MEEDLYELALNRMSVALATGLYLSYIPGQWLGKTPGFSARKWTGAGFIGTLEGLILLPLLPREPRDFALALIAAIGLSCWLCGRAEKVLGSHDDSRIVLDEIVGFWTSAAFLPRTPALLLAAFLLFRFFDSVKLPPYRWLERLPGGYGVVLDDIGAGLAANLILRGIIAAQS